MIFPGDISIYQRFINSLLTEVYKYAHGSSPEIMNDVFSTRANIYNTQQFNVFETDIPTLTDTVWIRYLTKQTKSGTYFLKTSDDLRHLLKNKIKLWECFNYRCNICKSYVRNLGYVFYAVNFSPAFSSILDTGSSLASVNDQLLS